MGTDTYNRFQLHTTCYQKPKKNNHIDPSMDPNNHMGAQGNVNAYEGGGGDGGSEGRDGAPCSHRGRGGHGGGCGRGTLQCRRGAGEMVGMAAREVKKEQLEGGERRARARARIG